MLFRVLRLLVPKSKHSLTLLAVVAVLPVSAQRVNWLFGSTDGMEVVSAVSARESQAVVRDLWQFRAAVSQVLPELSRLPRSDLRVFIIDRPAHRNELMTRELALDSRFIGKHISRPFYDTIIVDLEFRTIQRQVVQHELTHHLVAHLNRPIPVWLNEGLAETYAGAEMDGRRVSFGRLRGGSATYVAYESTLPFDMLWKLHPAMLNSDQTGAFYGTAHTLVHAGLFGNDEAFRAGFKSLREDPDLYNMSEEVVQRHLGMNHAQLERYLAAYLDHGTYRYLRFDRARLGEVPTLSFAPIDPADKAALLGSLGMIYNRNHGRAQMVGFDPDPRHVRLAMAMIDMAMGDDDPIDPRWLAVLEEGRKHPDAPAYLHLASAAAVFYKRTTRLSADEVAHVVEAIGAYRARRGLTRAARRYYVRAQARAAEPIAPEGIAGLVLLAERFGADPVLLRNAATALKRAGAEDRIAHLLESAAPDSAVAAAAEPGSGEP